MKKYIDVAMYSVNSFTHIAAHFFVLYEVCKITVVGQSGTTSAVVKNESN